MPAFFYYFLGATRELQRQIFSQLSEVATLSDSFIGNHSSTTDEVSMYSNATNVLMNAIQSSIDDMVDIESQSKDVSSKLDLLSYQATQTLDYSKTLYDLANGSLIEGRIYWKYRDGSLVEELALSAELLARIYG